MTHHIVFLVFLPLDPPVLPPLVFHQGDFHLLPDLLLSLSLASVPPGQRLPALLEILQEAVHVFADIILLLSIGFFHSRATRLSLSQTVLLRSSLSTGRVTRPACMTSSSSQLTPRSSLCWFVFMGVVGSRPPGHDCTHWSGCRNTPLGPIL